MKRKQVLCGITIIIAAAVFAVWNTGCETQSADAPVSISPPSARLNKGESAAFTAQGGFDYAWDLPDNKGLGSLNRTDGATVVYTSHESASGAVQVIRVTSRIQGSSSGNATSNDSPSTVTAEAFVTHL